MLEMNIKAKEYLQMGESLLGYGKVHEAIEKLDAALKIDPANVQTYIVKGIAYAMEEKYPSARKCFEHVIEAEDVGPEVYFQLGNIDFLENKFESGIAYFNKAVSLGYEGPEIYYNLALVYEQREQDDEAVRNYSKAIQIDPTNPAYYIRKVTILIRQERYDEAIRTLEKFRMNCPDHFEGYHLAAAVYTLMGHYDEADALLMNAQARFVKDMDLLLDRLHILLVKGDLTEAGQLLKKAESMESTLAERKELLLNKGRMLAMQEKTDKAQKCWNEALEIEEAEHLNSEIIFYLMNIDLEKKDYTNLIQLAKRIDRNKTDDEYSLASVYYECLALKSLKDAKYTKAYGDAICYYRCISLKDASRMDAFLFRAMCYRDIEDYTKALEILDYILLMRPDQKDLHSIRASIIERLRNQTGTDGVSGGEDFAESEI